MGQSDRQERERKERAKPARWLAVCLTFFVCGLAAHDQITSGSIDLGYQAMLVLLVLFWAGQGIDELLPRWFQ